MIIANEQLVTRLAEKTGLSAEQVEQKIQELTEEIHQTVAGGDDYTIEGFGTFSAGEDGVRFTPTRILETEINNKYAGMKPIELIGAFKEPETGEMPEMAADGSKARDVWMFDETQATGEESEELPGEQPPEEQSAVGDAPLSPQEPDIPEAGLPEDTAPVETGGEETVSGEPGQAEKPKPAAEEPAEPDDSGNQEPEEEYLSPESAPSGESSEQGEEVEAGKAEKGTTDNASETADKQEKAALKKEKDPIGRFIAAAVVVIAIGVGGWFGYQFLRNSDTNKAGSSLVEESTPPEASPQVHSQAVSDLREDGQSAEEAEATGGEAADDVEDTTAGTEGGSLTNEENAEPEAGEQVINNENNTSEKALNAPYGLRGDLDTTIGSWYTIVVHSLKDARLAETNKAQLVAEGYRVKINQVRVNEVLQYRVGIGQFATVEDALAAREELSEPYKSNNFIKRF